MSPAPPMFVIMPADISWISAMACFMRMSLMAPLRLSILARAVCIGDVAGLHQILVGGFGLLELRAVLGELGFHRLQAQRVLAGGGVVAGADMRGGLGAQVFLLGFELAHLAHEALGQAGVGGEALVEVADLLAQIFLLELQQGFGIAPFDARNKQGKETFEQVGNAAEHGTSRQNGAQRTREHEE